MNKQINRIPFAFKFDPAHKGAPYTIDGVHYMNGGQFKQIARVATLFDRVEKPDNIRYDMGSDIPELHESVKSSKATLVNMILGDDLQSTLNRYFATTASASHSWVTLVDDDVVAYIMNNTEFREFTETFGWYDNDRKVVRYKAESIKMLKWLEERL